ncbi:MAG: cation diffusion facilitator family transporter [Flavobacteriaceae bacterium]
MSHKHQTHEHQAQGNLKTAFFINLAFTIFEIFGGIYTNSIAIISDAVHDLGDSLSLGFAWYLEHKSNQKASVKYHFGYKRFSLLAALINCTVLIIGSIYVLTESVERILSPQESHAQGMFIMALIGVGVNGYAAWKVSKGKTMNERVVSWHLLEDVLGWVAVLIGSILLYFTNSLYIDPILSIGIGGFILFNVIKNLKKTLELFLLKAPNGLDYEKIKQQILKLQGVISILSFKVFSLDGEHHLAELTYRGPADLTLEEIDQLNHKIDALSKDLGIWKIHCEAKL